MKKKLCYNIYNHKAKGDDFMLKKASFLKRISNHSTKNNFVPLNDTFSYGRTGSTIHMHLVPDDLHDTMQSMKEDEFNKYISSKLEDFLTKLQGIVKSDNTIDNIFAVSPIFYHENWRRIHEEKGFDPIKEIILSQNDGMSQTQKKKFLKMFEGKKVFYTNMSRKKLLSQQYKSLENVDSEKNKEEIE